MITTNDTTSPITKALFLFLYLIAKIIVIMGMKIDIIKKGTKAIEQVNLITLNIKLAKNSNPIGTINPKMNHIIFFISTPLRHINESCLFGALQKIFASYSGLTRLDLSST
jgi:hypothetical protein